jgi:hypothetical protein
MSKQDRQGVRTINDLERKYYFERAFSEVMGVANNAQTTAQKTAEKVTAELSLVIKKDDAGQIVSMLNASADIIKIKGNRISIESDNFTLAADGTVTAKNGVFDNCEIKETCTIKGKLAGNTISSITTASGATGEIAFTETASGAYYTIDFNGGDLMRAGMQLGTFNGEIGARIYTEYASIDVLEDITLQAVGDINLNTTMGNVLFNGVNIASQLEALDTRLKALEGA